MSACAQLWKIKKLRKSNQQFYWKTVLKMYIRNSAYSHWLLPGKWLYRNEAFSLTLCVSYTMIQKMVHTWRGRGRSIFIEINVKRQSNPPPPKVCSIQRCTAHIQPSNIISKYDFKKCASFWHNSRGNYVGFKGTIM